MVKLLSILLVFTCLVSCGGGPSVDQDEVDRFSANGEPSNKSVAFGLSYPGVAEAENREFAYFNLEALSLSRVRFDESWSYRETVQDEFNWTPLDERMQWLTEHDISVLLTIQANGPHWACIPELSNERTCVFNDVSKFENYIQTLLQRYPNQIEQIQFGNEWLSSYWFLGSGADYVLYNNIMYDLVQQYSPNTKVVLGGFASGSVSIISFCAGNLDMFFDEQTGDVIDSSQRHLVCSSEKMISSQLMLKEVLEYAKYNYLDIHLYDDVENWPNYLRTMRNVVGDSVSVIVSEFGGPNLIWEEPYSDEFQAARLEQYLEALSEMDIMEAYYFKLVQSETALMSHWESGLYKIEEGTYSKKPAFDVFEQFMERY